MSGETKEILISALREDFEKNAGWITHMKWVNAAIEIGAYELAKEFKDQSKELENAI